MGNWYNVVMTTIITFVVLIIIDMLVGDMHSILNLGGNSIGCKI